MVAIRPFGGVHCGQGKASIEIAGEMMHLP